MGLTLPELRKKGWEALVKDLGYADAIKFILLHEKGEGDYLKEKDRIFSGKKAKEIFEEIEKYQASEG